MKKYRYRCEFVFKGKQLAVYSDEGLAAFKDGFWLNENYQYTKGDDCLYWIPPVCIEYVAKDSVRQS